MTDLDIMVPATIAIILTIGFGIWFIYSLITEDSDRKGLHQLHFKAENSSYKYSEKEFVLLYNYCVRKYNSNTFRYEYMKNQLRKIEAARENPYKNFSYTDLSLWCLRLLSRSEQEEINFGRVNK